MANAILYVYLYNRIPLFIALVVRPSPYRKLWFLPILCLNIWLLFCVPNTGESPSTSNSLGCAIFCSVLTASDFILLTDVQKELRLQNDKRDIPASSLSARMVWALKLMTSQRAVGWAHEPTGRIPAKPKTSRWTFVVSRLFLGAYYYMLSDLLRILAQWRFAVVRRGTTDVGVLGSLLDRMTYLTALAEVQMGLTMPYICMSAVSVALGLTEPKEWPAMFGSWSEAYTIGRFWGRTWHQMLRRLLTVHAKFVVKVLHIKNGTSLSWHVQLFVVFTLSALLHLVGEYRIFNNWTSGGAMSFFVIQAVGITIEDMIIALASKIGFRKTTSLSKLVGYVWVCGWLTWTIVWWIGPLTKARFGTPDDKQSVILEFFQRALANETFSIKGQ